MVDFENKSEHVIRSKCFRSTIFGIFSLAHKKEEVWLDGTHPMLFADPSFVYMQSFRPVILFFFLAKLPLWLFSSFLNIERGVAT